MKITFEGEQLFGFLNRLYDTTERDYYLGIATKRIAESLNRVLLQKTPLDFGTLRLGWDTPENKAYIVEKTKTGYEVTLYNRTEYASWVNYGHRQQPGRFIPGYWEGNHFRYDRNADGGMVLKQSWVQGRFFVENSIAEVEDAARKIIFEQLTKWMEWCIGG